MMLELRVDQNIVRLTLSHESLGNSFGAKEAEVLQKALKVKGAQGLVMIGAGSRFFCTGGNLAEQSKAKTSKTSLAAQKKVRAALEALTRFPHPTLALVNGDCFGGGTELVSAFDHVVAAPHVLFGFWQRKLGLTFGWGGGMRLRSKMGERLFTEALTAKTFTSYRAVDLGLVDRVVPGSRLESEGLSWLKSVLSLPSYAEFKALKHDSKIESKIFDRLWMNPAHKKIVEGHSR